MKYLISASAAVLMLSAASADMLAQEEQAPAEENNQEEIIEDNCNCNLLNGFYAGLGIGYSNSKNGNLLKVTKWANTTADGTAETTSNKANKFIGTVVLGAGKVFGQGFYVGGEGMIDFSKKKKKYEKYTATAPGGTDITGVTTVANDQFVTKTINKGFDWNLGVRAGYAVQNGTLVYAKAGVTQGKLTEEVYVATSATDNSQNTTTGKQPYLAHDGTSGKNGTQLPLSYSCNKVAPMIALGVEKVMSNGLSGRVEIEYDFKAKKKYTSPVDGTTKLKLQRKNGFKARLLLAKHISM